MKKNDFFIIVNSTDSFSDCWEAFFTLFKRFWPKPWPKIVLNAESLGYEDSELSIYNARTFHVFGRKLTWSESIKYCCTLMPESVILYLQDDYFFTNAVRTDVIAEALELFHCTEVASVQLATSGSVGESSSIKDGKFVTYDKKAKYLTTCQAALWNKHILCNLLRDDENAWQFEIFGNYRARKSVWLYLSIPKNTTFVPAISYVERTGIIKGRWNTSTEELFNKYDISVDFNKRGFYSNVGIIRNKFNTLKKLIDNPLVIINRILGR
jgi:hypothetical protein